MLNTMRELEQLVQSSGANMKAMLDLINVYYDVTDQHMDLDQYLPGSARKDPDDPPENGSGATQASQPEQGGVRLLARPKAVKHAANSVSKRNAVLRSTEKHLDDTEEFELSLQFIDLQLQYLSTSVQYYDMETGLFVSGPVAESDDDCDCTDCSANSSASSGDSDRPADSTSDDPLDLDFLSLLDFESDTDYMDCIAWEQSLTESWLETFSSPDEECVTLSC